MRETGEQKLRTESAVQLTFSHFLRCSLAFCAVCGRLRCGCVVLSLSLLGGKDMVESEEREGLRGRTDWLISFICSVPSLDEEIQRMLTSGPWRRRLRERRKEVSWTSRTENDWSICSLLWLTVCVCLCLFVCFSLQSKEKELQESLRLCQQQREQIEEVQHKPRSPFAMHILLRRWSWWEGQGRARVEVLIRSKCNREQTRANYGGEGDLEGFFRISHHVAVNGVCEDSGVDRDHLSRLEVMAFSRSISLCRQSRSSSVSIFRFQRDRRKPHLPFIRAVPFRCMIFWPRSSHFILSFRLSSLAFCVSFHSSVSLSLPLQRDSKPRHHFFLVPLSFMISF